MSNEFQFAAARQTQPFFSRKWKRLEQHIKIVYYKKYNEICESLLVIYRRENQ